MFGRKKSGGPASSKLRESLDLESAEDIAWVKQTDNPLIWHCVALSTLLFRGDSQDFLAWVVEQERMDRVTALAIFLAQSNGKDRLTGGVLPPDEMPEPYRSKHRRINHVIDRLCQLDTQRSWPEHGIGLEDGWEKGRQDLLVELGGDRRFPRHLFAKPIPPQTVKMPYTDLGEGDLMSQDYIREHMPYLLD